MHKSDFILLLALGYAALLPGPVFAQSNPANAGPSAGRLSVGQVDAVFDYGKLTPTQWHLIGHVKLTSQDYDLAGDDIQVFFASGKKGAASLVKAVALGNAKTGQQVTAHIRQPLQGQSYEVLADQTIYTPDSSRPGGGKMEFTGHVKLVTNSGFLTGPSVSTFEHATLLLGQGADYPQLITGPAHITFTPAQ